MITGIFLRPVGRRKTINNSVKIMLISSRFFWRKHCDFTIGMVIFVPYVKCRFQANIY